MTTAELTRWQSALQSGDPYRIAGTARELAEAKSQPDTDFRFTVYDQLWRPVGEIGGELMEASGTDPRNNVGSAKLKIKGDSHLIGVFQQCRTTLVGVTVETAGLRWAFYVDSFDYEFENGEWTGTANLLSIWDILNYLVIWPSWYLPIQAQPFSHAVYIWALCTVIESMISECALRIQSGLWEFVNNALSLNPDIRAWFGTLLQSNANIFQMLKTPVYVVRTNPFLDTSPLAARLVRMESCGTVIKDITPAYGVDVSVDLWFPGDPQPDVWTRTIPFMALDQPTYVVTVKDRSQIEGPTKTVLDSVLRTVVDLEGSLLGRTMDPILNPRGEYAPSDNLEMFTAPALGLHFVPPYAILVAPDPGEDSSILSCKISDHTPKGWQHIIGGRSPKWLNDLINATTAWIIDSIMIVVGLTGVPSDLLAGFLNNAFLAFQLIEHYTRRAEVGPYHPAIEVFHATASAPYNVETVFAFINALWDSRGYTTAIVTFRNGDQYALGRDIFRGGLMSLVYMGRRKMLTDYIENIMWRITPDVREVTVQLGDGKRGEAPLAKHQRFITAIFEAINVLTLAPQSG
ncbi:hypothetical protein [Mycobacterium xenopi]|nr:hypothetical protein [Mycobacterium xenopi]ORX21598.1 hypothetical protein AWC32_21535 [Mycobacterium xenopi]SPX78046.1 gp36 protein [Mycobacterium xenopi]